MTRVVKLLACLLAPPALIWLVIGFITWNWNPATWTEDARATYVLFSFLVTAPTVIVFGGV